MAKALEDALSLIHAAAAGGGPEWNPAEGCLERLVSKLTEMEDVLRSLSTLPGNNGGGGGGGAALPPLLDACRTTLALPQHTIGVTFLLLAQASSLGAQGAGGPTPTHAAFLELCEGLLQHFDPVQARVASKKFAQLARKYTTLLSNGHSAPHLPSAANNAAAAAAAGAAPGSPASADGDNAGAAAAAGGATGGSAAPSPLPALPAPSQVVRGLVPLERAALRLAPRPHCLTPLHVDFLQVALLAKQYRRAAAFLGANPIYEVDPKLTGLGSADLLRHFHHAGLVYAAQGRFADAFDAFKTAVTIPAHALSAVAADAYKKLLLVWYLLPASHSAAAEAAADTAAALAASGKPMGGKAPMAHSAASAPASFPFSLPKYTAPVVSRQVRHAAEAYLTIISVATQSDKPADLRACLAKHAEMLAADGNDGLAQRVLDQHAVKGLQKLARTFQTLALDEIARRLGLPSAAEAEHFLVTQVSAGQVEAALDATSGVVHFPEQAGDEEDGAFSAATIARLNKELGAVMALAGTVQALDQRIAAVPVYVAKVTAARGGGGGGGGGGSGAGGGGAGDGGTIAFGGGGGDAYGDDMMVGEDDGEDDDDDEGGMGGMMGSRHAHPFASSHS